MSCDHAHCTREATVRCRMGDGLVDRGGRRGRKQTYVYYCDPCFQRVDRMFRLCDIGLIPGYNGRPFGPLDAAVNDRHTGKVARPTR
jgi:hypothetical protein